MLRKLRNLFQQQKLSRDISEELEFHRSQTSGQLGNATRIAEDAREASIVLWLETLFQDLRYGARQLRKSPLLLTIAVLSLALGIGANTAIFTVINAVMLQSLPVRDPARLVLFYDGWDTGVYSGDDPSQNRFSSLSAEYLRRHTSVFESLCSFRQSIDSANMHMVGERDAASTERVRAHLVSGNYFETLGVEAAAGRLLRSEDDRVGADPVAVLSYDFWKTRFGKSPAALGKVVTLNGGTFTIAGVAAPEFFGERIEQPPDFWVPSSFQPQLMRGESWLQKRDTYWLNMMGRLKPGVTRAQAQAAVTVQLQTYYREAAGEKPTGETLKKIAALHPTLTPGGSGISGLRARYSEPLHVLMAVVALVLLIACANIATLLLARDMVRRPEFLARLALGASRGRLLRQILTESVLLSSVGGIAGVAVAFVSVRLLANAMSITPVVKLQPNMGVLLFTVAVSLGTGLLFGLLPALRSSRLDLRPLAGSGGTHSKKWRGSAQALIVLQVALCTVLLVSSGLLVRSLAELTGQQAGFRKDNLLIVQTDPQLAGYEANQLYPLYRDLDARLNAIPGVRSATVARYTPISGNKSTDNFSIEGYAPPPGKRLDLDDLEVGPRFFETLGIPLLLGRVIDARDTPSSEVVTVINQSFVKTFFPGQNPIGRRIALDRTFQPPGAKIIGVVADSKFSTLRDDVVPMAFFSIWQRGVSPSLLYARDLVLRTAQPPLELAGSVRQVLKSIDSRLPVLRVTTMASQIDASLEQQHLLSALCSVFGTLALTLALVGIYGTLTYSVARRKAEIGIRMAIGAQRRHVLWTVLRESVLLVIIGLAVGLPLSYWAGTAVRSLLYGVSPADPLAIAIALSAVAILSLLAAYLPARRATKIDPLSALRYE